MLLATIALCCVALIGFAAHRATLGRVADGWVISEVGAYGTDYMKRAVVGAFGWPANLDKDAVYPYTEVDSTGAPLSWAS